MVQFDFRNKKGVCADEIYIFGDNIPPQGQAIIVPPGCKMPKDTFPVLYVTKVKIFDYSYGENDTNNDGIWAYLCKDSSKKADVIVSDFEIPDGKLKCKIPTCVPECLSGVVEYFNDLFDVKRVLDCDFMRIFTENGMKMIEPHHYYYYAGELEKGNGKPFRVVDIRKAKVSLGEYITKLHSADYDEWYNGLLEQAQQYCLEITPAELISYVQEDLKSVLFQKRFTLDVPDGMYL